MQQTKLLLVSSSGGHLSSLLELRRWWRRYPERLWVVNPAVARFQGIGAERIVAGHFPDNRSVWALWHNFWLARRVIGSEQPNVLVTFGAAVAVPFLFWARLYRVRSVFIEPYVMTTRATLAGRIAYRLVDDFVVQDERMRRLYPKARVCQWKV